MGDWKLLAWAPYPGETRAELDERVAPNARAMKAERDAKRAIEEAQWETEQAQRAQAGAS